MRFTIVACSIIILITVGAACQIADEIRSGRGAGQGPLRLTIEPTDQNCESSEECVLVWTDCSTCDCGTPVHRHHQEKYQKAYRELCVDYSGPVCEIYCPPAELICEQGVCTILIEESVE
jgi:hypothetical protein